MATPDMELKKRFARAIKQDASVQAFAELQAKMVSSSQQIKVSEMQIESLKRTMKHAQLVEQELAQIPDTTRCYDGIGKMFVLESVASIKENLAKKTAVAENKIKTIEKNRTHMEKSLKESEDNLRELIISKQQK